MDSKRTASILLVYIPKPAPELSSLTQFSAALAFRYHTRCPLPAAHPTSQSYFKTVKLNISHSEVLSTVPHTLVWLASAHKILPDGPPDTLPPLQEHLGKNSMSRHTGPYRGSAQLTTKARAESAWGTTFARGKGGRSAGCSPRPATKASRQPECTPRAPGPPPAPGPREPRTAPWKTGRERGAPWRRGLCPSAPGRRRRRGLASLHLQTPVAASLRAAAPLASRAPLDISLQSPPPAPL